MSFVVLHNAFVRASIASAFGLWTWIAMTRSSDPTPARDLAAITAPQLPRDVPPSRDPYPGKACTQSAPPGVRLQKVLAKARGGDVVCLVAGGTYPPFQLPARAAGDTGWIVVRTAGALPSEGTRMRPSLAGSLAKIVATQS